jgi:cytochrome c553
MLDGPSARAERARRAEQGLPSTVVGNLRVQEGGPAWARARSGDYKCWFCHNEFTKHIPKLTGLYQHPALLSGQPVNDDTVKDKIRNGGPAMAAYKYTLSDADLDDLVSYLREKCCWNSDSPPSNPRYLAR